MSKNVTFGLGPAVGLASRTLTITRHTRAGDDSAPSAQHSADAGSTATYVTVTLPDNTLWRAELTDVISGAGAGGADLASRVDRLSFHTGSLQFPGPHSGDRLCILSMEDLSSSSQSSSSSTSSSSSSESSSSASSISSISTSSSSTSSISTSSSSISTSSSSSSSSTSSYSSSSVSTSSQSSISTSTSSQD